MRTETPSVGSALVVRGPIEGEDKGIVDVKTTGRVASTKSSTLVMMSRKGTTFSSPSSPGWGGTGAASRRMEDRCAGERGVMEHRTAPWEESSELPEIERS